MKIGYITCVFPPYRSGISTTSYDFAKIMANSGNEVVVITTLQGDKLENENFKIIYLKPWIKFGHGYFIPQIIRAIRRENFDVLHFHCPFFGAVEVIALYFLFKSKNIPLAIHYHMDFLAPNILLKILSFGQIATKYLCRKADIITVSTFDMLKNSMIKSIYGLYPEKFCEIKFGVDLEKFKPDYGRKINKLLFVGALDKAHYFKGVDILIRSFAMLNRKDIVLDVVGDGDMKMQYEKLSQELKLNNIIFSGSIDRAALIKKYQESKAVILPSINEGEAFGMVLIEALACGTPVIASNLPGVRTVFDDGINGMLVKPNDSDDLRLKIELLLNNPDISAMNTRARKKAEENYDIKKNILKLNDIYKKLT